MRAKPEKPSHVFALAGLFAAALLAGCMSGADGPPGSHAQRMSILGGVQQAWTRVRVAAPEGARRCWLDNAPLGSGGRGRSDLVRDGAAMLSIDTNMESARIVCAGSGGEVARVVPRVQLSAGDSVIPVMPPLIHVGALDDRADARWAALHAELCSTGENELLCGSAQFAQLRQADIGR